MKTLPLVEARILAPVVGFLESNGAKAERYLDRLRIPGEMVSSGGKIAKKQCHDFLLNVAQSERCDEVGFAAYQSFQLSDLGGIATAMASAKTVKEALEIFTRLANDAYEGNEYALTTDGRTARLCFHDHDYVSPGYIYSHHVTLMAYHKIIRAVADESWRPQSFCCHGREIGPFNRVDGFEDCATKYHADETSLDIPVEFLSRRPLLGRGNGATIDHVASTLTEPSNGRDTFVGSLQRLIASRYLYGKLPTLDQIATIIDVSPRTVQRCLQSEGLSYRGLLDRICFDAACEMLATRQITIREIALELGYSGTNNFVRGFRRMTAMTPSEYRRRRLG
ncbi:MAG: AraC family transcriptional regulator [Candidatus Tectomicrobia bacterium]|nr:AraC family transcriptional regulator [Candidatus Tectomicrobia bacterium]